MMRQPRTWVAATLAILVAAIASQATVLVPADLSELSRSAAAIVRGTVTGVAPQWADGRRRVETVVTVEVQQALKGDLGKTVTFKVPGGRLGRYRSVMVGAPAFQLGEEVVLFLGAAPPALPYLLGLGQGVYRVRRDAATGRARVVSPALFAESETVQVRRGDASRRAVSLEAFTASVRAAMISSPSERRRATPRAPDKRPR